MIKINLRTQSGHYVVANDSRAEHAIGATPEGAGAWEVFTVFSASGEELDTIRSGDRVHLQTHHGRYVMAKNGGGGAVTAPATPGQTVTKPTPGQTAPATTQSQRGGFGSTGSSGGSSGSS